jgi:DNA repair protein RadC
MIVSQRKQKINNSAQLAEVLQSILATEDMIGQQREHFWTIGLNIKNVVQYVELVSLGTLDASLVHPREVFRLAITKGVSAIVVGHNHPSGDVTPSKEDKEVTARLRACGELLGINVLDHVIITPDTYFSLGG